MPRTKAPRKKVEKISVAKSLNDQVFRELDIYCEDQVKFFRDLRDSTINALKEQVNYSLMEFKHPNRTMRELRHTIQSTLMKTACDNLDGLAKSNEKKTRTKKNRRSASCAADDDGYLTGDSATSKGTRASRGRSRVAAPLANSTTRVSRSLSRSQPQQLNVTKTISKKNGYTTPLKQQPSTTYGMVTPKMQRNAPQLLLRRPKNGEVAISLEGSPLMVNPVATDNTANVNIPLGEGRLLSLQPGRGLRISQVPQIDEETRRQLLTLKDHIQKICGNIRQ